MPPLRRGCGCGGHPGAIRGGCSGLNTVGGNRTTDQLFANGGAGDPPLQAGSPAIDYAMAEFSMPADHDRHARPQAPAADAGSYER